MPSPPYCSQQVRLLPPALKRLQRIDVKTTVHAHLKLATDRYAAHKCRRTSIGEFLEALLLEDEDAMAFSRDTNHLRALKPGELSVELSRRMRR